MKPSWGNTLGVIFEITLLLIILRRRWHGIQEHTLARTTVKTVAASLIMGAFIVITEALWHSAGLGERGRVMTIVQIAVQVIAGGSIFILAAWFLRLDALRDFALQLLRRLRPAEAIA